MNIKPLQDYVLCEEVKDPGSKTSSGIFLPDTVNKMVRATVLGVGPGRQLDNGEFEAMNIKIGNQILIHPGYVGQKISLPEGKFLIQANVIMAVVND